MSQFSHTWDLSPKEAYALQKKLASHVIRQATLGQVKTVAGIDASYQNGMAHAAIVVLSYPSLTPIEQTKLKRPANFPYVPGLLSFREGPVVLEALETLQTRPDLLIFDGQGLAHPRRFGLACHIGLLLDIPSIGCAKSRLCGQYEEPGLVRGDFSYLYHKGEAIGAVLRTRSNVKPVFVSIGHRVDLQTSIAYVLGCCTRYRLPETTRWADKIAAEWEKQG